MEPIASAQDIQTKFFLLYSKLIENNETGKAILALLKSDNRVNNLNGKLVSRGSGGDAFDVKNLAMWYLWAINEFGQEKAESNLNYFLDSETIPVINTLWVLGLEVDEPINLYNGVKILPVQDMPISRDKELYLRHEFNVPHHANLKPRAAITYICDVKKSVSSQGVMDVEEDKKFWEINRLLYDISFVLNAIDAISCIPFYSTSYSLPEIPMGLFGSSGGGSPLYDLYGHHLSKLQNLKTPEINQLIKAFSLLESNEKKRIERVLFRLSQAKRGIQIEDKMLDLGIALEMLLLDDNKNNDQLSLSFRIRGSWLIGKNVEERKLIYKKLQSIYNYRSQVAHSGILCKNNPTKIDEIRKIFPDYADLAGMIIRKIINDGRPKWSNIILGET